MLATEEERRLDESLWSESVRQGTELLRVWTKCDSVSGLSLDGSTILARARLLPSREPGMTSASEHGSAGASPSRTGETIRGLTPTGSPRQCVSALTGEGIAALETEVVQRFSLQAAHRGEWLATTAARSRDSLGRCVDCLHAAKAAAEQHLGDELISIELRAALDALGEICGAVHTDDILDRIFSRFCIGK